MHTKNQHNLGLHPDLHLPSLLSPPPPPVSSLAVRTFVLVVATVLRVEWKWSSFPIRQKNKNPENNILIVEISVEHEPVRISA